jgi:hypothetical protein
LSAALAFPREIFNLERFRRRMVARNGLPLDTCSHIKTNQDSCDNKTATLAGTIVVKG